MCTWEQGGSNFWYFHAYVLCEQPPWVMLCSHCPINDQSGYLHNTIYLAVVLQASWHTAEGNWESKGSYIKSYHLLLVISDWTKNTPLWLTKRIISNDLRKEIANNFKKLNNVHSNDINFPNIILSLASLSGSSFWKAVEYF